MQTVPGFVVRRMAEEHVPGAVDLQRACFPPPFPDGLLWRAEHLTRHLATYPSGQFVALHGGVVIGSASALVITEENWQLHADWESTVGGMAFESHDDRGSTMFGADISVHPDWRRRGIGRALYEARFSVVSTSGLSRFGTACRIPDWRGSNLTHDDYCALVCAHERTDRTLSPLLRFGMQFVSVAHGHMVDPESGDAAAILEWIP